MNNSVPENFIYQNVPLGSMTRTWFGLDFGVRRDNESTKLAKLKLPVPQLDQPGAIFVRNPEYSFAWMQRDPLFWLLERLHPSPTGKFDALYHKLLADGGMKGEEFTRSRPLDEGDFARVHTPEYLEHLERTARQFFGYGGLLSTFGRIDYTPTVPHLLAFAKASCAGTYHAATIALERGFAMNLSGGFHHAFPDHEAGYCHLNDIAIAIRRLRTEKRIQRPMIVDCDVHNGDGNATIFSSDFFTFIFDIYQTDNRYPRVKVNHGFGHSVSLSSEEGIDDNRYLFELKKLKGIVAHEKPDIIFYLAGADPHEGDRLGGFKVTHAGLAQRDRYVLEAGQQNHVPVVVVTAGGYGNNLDDVVKVHYNTAMAVRDFAKGVHRAEKVSADAAR